MVGLAPADQIDQPDVLGFCRKRKRELGRARLGRRRSVNRFFGGNKLQLDSSVAFALNGVVRRLVTSQIRSRKHDRVAFLMFRSDSDLIGSRMEDWDQDTQTLTGF